MGEIIARARPTQALAFTGERLTTDYGGQTEIEHLHRYLLAREWCRGKDVLDVASGEGYGTAMLAQVARSTVGVEIAQDAVDHATAAYTATNLRFLAGDARTLPIEDACVDVVVSFETIEHFAEQAQFLAEVHRVLRAGGLFIVSTPDRDNYSPAETPANPYHVQELTRTEFETLLGSRFQHVGLLSQRPVFGSVMLPSSGNDATPLSYERRGNDHFEGSVGLSRPQYYFALASDAPLPALPASIYIDTGRLGMESPAEAAARTARAEQLLEAHRGQASTAELAELQRHANDLADERRRHAVDLDTLRRQSEDEVLALRAALARAEATAALHQDTVAELAAQQAELAARQAELAGAHGEIKGLVSANEMAERAVRQLSRDVATAKEPLSAATAALQAKELELQQLRRDHGELTAVKEDALARLADRRAAELDLRRDLGTAMTRLAEAKAERDAAQARVHTLETDVSGIHASTSWRLTRPLRAVGRNLLRRP